MKCDFTQAEVNVAFEKLKACLEKSPISGCQFDDFMLMFKDEKGRFAFKHYDTREYVYLEGDIVVPPPTQPERNLAFHEDIPF